MLVTYCYGLLFKILQSAGVMLACSAAAEPSTARRRAESFTKSASRRWSSFFYDKHVALCDLRHNNRPARAGRLEAPG